MRSLGILTLMLAVAVGCSKKPKETQPDSAPPPPVAAGPKQTTSGNNSGGGSNVSVIPTPVGGGVVTNVGGGGGSGGAAQAVRKAARRAGALNEMKNLGEFIESLRDEFGKMPTKDRIMTELKRSAPTIHTAIEEGSYILTGTTEGGGVWAYEVDSDKLGGILVIGGRATRTNVDEARQYLGLPLRP